jgi:hypothetical protein
MNEDYVPRFSFEINEKQKARADKLLATYGLRKAIFGRILDDVLDLIEQYGGAVVGILMTEKPHEILPGMKEAEEKGKR